MKKREAKFQTRFNQWLRYVYLKNAKTAIAFELKSTDGKSIPFNAVQTHQKDSLYNAKHTCLIYKIPDDSAGFKPMDSFALCGVRAYVVLEFTRSKKWYLIDIDNWLAYEKVSERKSITEEEASGLAELVVSLSDI
jgi:penicillin-binding protein-related factor A (putative recombinase)